MIHQANRLIQFLIGPFINTIFPSMLLVQSQIVLQAFMKSELLHPYFHNLATFENSEQVFIRFFAKKDFDVNLPL